MLRHLLRLTLIAALTTLSSCEASRAAGRAERFPLHTTVARALRDQRRSVALLSGSTPRSTCRPANTSAIVPACAGATIDARALRNALRAVDGQSPNDDRTWSMALIDLAAGPGDARLVTIVDSLQRLVDRHPRVAALRNDLAVADLLEYANHHAAADLVAAFDDIERAFADDPTSEVVAANRALIRAAVGLVAVTADMPRPPHLREDAFDTQLVAWANAIRTADTARATAVRRTLRAVGDTLLRRSADSSVLRMALALSDPSLNVADAANGVTAYVNATRAFRVGQYAQAGAAFSAMLAHPTHVPDALLDWTRASYANVLHFRAHYDSSDALYASTERAAIAHGDVALQATLHAGHALSLIRRGRTGPSATEYQRAAALYAQLGESWNQAFMVSQFGDVQFQLGDDDAGLSAKLQALALQRTGADATSRISTLMAFGEQLRSIGLTYAALAVLHAALDLAHTSTRPADRVEAGVRVARATHAIGNTASARRVLADVERDMAAVTDPILRDRLHMEVWRTQTLLEQATHPSVALAFADSTAAYFRQRHIVFSLADPLITAAQLRARLGDTSGAQANLDEAVASIEAQASLAHNASAERDMRASRRSAYAELVQLALARRDTLGAFRLVERARNNPAATTASLEPGTVYLSYALARDACLLWIASARGLRLVTVSRDTTALLALARSFRESIRTNANDPRVAAEARALFDTLVAPAQPELASAAAVVIVADGPLDALPFPALRDSTGATLLERTPLTYAQAVRPAHAAPRVSGQVLVVGDPDFDPQLFDGLPRLASAAAEAQGAARAFPHAHLLIGERATRSALLPSLRTARLFHFAGHARLVPRAPGRSHLVLARAPGELADNALTADDIAHLPLAHLRLVVLSSCGTAQRRTARDPSSNGLTEAFLAAGAAEVVASSWEADDAGTARLMAAVDRGVAAGLPAAIALRDAQLELLRTHDDAVGPAVWAGFGVHRR